MKNIPFQANYLYYPRISILHIFGTNEVSKNSSFCIFLHVFLHGIEIFWNENKNIKRILDTFDEKPISTFLFTLASLKYRQTFE